MKKFLMGISMVALMVSVVPAKAASTLAIGGGAQLSGVTTTTGALSLGNAVSAAGAAGNNTSVGAGTAVSTPVGGFSAGIGASVGQTAGASGAIAGPNGAAISGSRVIGGGVGVGGGFTNTTP